jgi:hypothetical protein
MMSRRRVSLCRAVAAPLAGRLSRGIREQLATTPPLPPSAGSDLCLALEVAMSLLLQEGGGAWSSEVVDAVYVTELSKESGNRTHLLGSVILLSDQCFHPFGMTINLDADGGVREISLGIGFNGGGMRVRGVEYDYSAADKISQSVANRGKLDGWAYCVSAS